MVKLLGGRYEIEEQIGGGGMAVVYRAADTLLGRPVAVKMLRPQYAGDEEFVRRFRQEAQSAARLSHPNIVNLYDVGTVNGEYFIVMEYVDGPTLKDVIRERGPLSVPEALDITRQICDALEHAHDHHIIHRDIKPHNILLTKSGMVKVTDFGLARAMTGNTLTHHHESSVLGSVHYFSPEQARGGMTDIKTDIYSLGVVMYEMLTRELPFSGDSPVSVALKHLRSSFVEPRVLNPQIPQSVENVILRCLVKSPDARYADMRAVKADLADALIHPNVPKFVVPEVVSDETIAIPVVGGISSSVDEDKPASRPAPVKKRKWWRSALWTLVALGVLMVGAFAAYYIVMDLIQVPNVSLPNVVGQSETAAVNHLKQAGFTASQIQEQKAANAKPKGVVYAQDPQGPTEVKQNRSVTLYISTGPPQITMPNLQGVPLDQAVTTLEDAGFPSSKIQEQPVNSTENAGLVVQTQPAAGASVSMDGTVVLQYSQGSMTTVPNVINMTVNQAKAALASANLQLGQIYQMPYPVQDQTVFKMVPYAAGQQVPTGTKIDLYVANNSGGSGGPAGSQNATGGTGGTSGTGSTGSTGSTSSTAPPTNLPSNTEVKPVEVIVPDPSGKNIAVQIVKSDITGKNQTYADQVINSKTTWTVPLYLTPGSTGEVRVYENGNLVQREVLSY